MILPAPFHVKVESCWLVTREGVTVHLKPTLEEVPAAYPTVHTTFNRQIQTRSTGRQKLVGTEVSVQVGGTVRKNSVSACGATGGRSWCL